MSIEAELLASYHLVDPEKTIFRLRPSSKKSDRVPFHQNALFQKPRHQLYRQSWERASSKILKMVDYLQSELLDDLVRFINTTTFNFASFIRQPIPTAVLLGASKILNASLAARLTSLRDPSVGPECLPIQLNSRSCLNLSTTIKCIVNLLDRQLENLMDGDSYQTIKTLRASDSLARDDVQKIRLLYKECWNQSAKISSNEANSLAKPKLIFIIDDFEAFDPDVLENLILILSNMIAEIPIMVILSLSTSVEAITSMLPRSVIFRLRMTPFAVDMDGEVITSLIEKVLLDPENPFDVSSGVMRALMDGYEKRNKSIDNMIAKFQFIHLAYFYTNPVCEFINQASAETGKEDNVLDEKDLRRLLPNLEYLAHHLRLTTSWKRTRRAQPANDPETLQILLKSYSSKKENCQRSLVALETLRRIGRLWPEKERTSEWILYHIYRNDLVTYSTELCKLIKHSSDEMLVNLLKSIEGLSAEFDWLESSLTRISELLVDEEIRQTGTRSHLFNTNEPLPAGIKLFVADREFTEIISNVVESLLEFFRKHLGPENSLALQEAWTFDDKFLLNQVFHPAYIPQIKSELESKDDDHGGNAERSKEKMNANGHAGEDEGLRRLRKIYELYMETDGKVINLHDWFGAFEQSYQSLQTSRSQEGVQKRRKKNSISKNKEAPDNPLQVEKHFLTSLADLAFLGLISNCGRKKEHVTKHFFG